MKRMQLLDYYWDALYFLILHITLGLRNQADHKIFITFAMICAVWWRLIVCLGSYCANDLLRKTELLHVSGTGELQRDVNWPTIAMETKGIQGCQRNLRAINWCACWPLRCFRRSLRRHKCGSLFCLKITDSSMCSTGWQISKTNDTSL